MKLVGFFREISYGEKEVRGESLLDAIRIPGDYSVEGMTGYLASGYPVLDVMEITSDLAGRRFQSPGGSSVMTDGEYAWCVDLTDYVRHYRINLPEEFNRWVESNSCKVPEVARQRLIDISISVKEILGFSADPGAASR